MNDTSTALAIIEEKNVATYFQPQGLDPVIEKIRGEVEAQRLALDISTQKGRDGIASLAHKVARTKTALDALGKKLTEDQKKAIKAVDVERARAWDALEALQKEVRAPLTEWENKNKARIAAHEEALAAITEHPGYGQQETAEQIAQRLAHLENLPSREWEEFKDRAAKVLADEIDRTRKLLAAAQKREADQAELERLRSEQAEREQRERDERLKAEAAEQARKEAEDKARQEAEAEAARVRAEQEAAAAREDALKREREKAERERAEAEARAKKAEADRLAAVAQAEADRKAAEEKAERDRLAAEEKAKRDAEAAAKAERDRIETEKKAEADATAKREADKQHRTKINREALTAMIAAGLTEELGKRVVGAIAKGEIPHVKISY